MGSKNLLKQSIEQMKAKNENLINRKKANDKSSQEKLVDLHNKLLLKKNLSEKVLQMNKDKS